MSCLEVKSDTMYIELSTENVLGGDWLFSASLLDSLFLDLPVRWQVTTKCSLLCQLGGWRLIHAVKKKTERWNKIVAGEDYRGPSILICIMKGLDGVYVIFFSE